MKNKGIETNKYISEEKAERAGLDLSRIELLINLCIGIIYLHISILGLRYLIAIATLDRKIISNNIVYIVIAAIMGPVVWVYSTKTEYWNFHNRKIFLFKTCVANTVGVLLEPVYTAVWKIIIPWVFRIETNAALTSGMIILLGQILMVVLMAVIICVLYLTMLKPIFFNDKMTEKIKRFKISHYVDERDYAEFQYDLKIAKALDTGRDIIIKMADRFVHLLINGASGTGKTSSVFLPAIAGDMDQRLKNRKERIKVLVKMLLHRHAYMEGPVTEFDEYKIKPKPGYEKEYESLYKNIPDCGITVLAPNNAVIMTILELADARGEKVNVIDPAESEGYKKFKSYKKMGMNPFFVPPNLPEREKEIWLVDVANMFAEILVAVNERSGKSEVYFTDITKSILNYTAILCMLARNIKGEQTDIMEVRDCITNPSELKKFIDIIEKHYNIKVIVQSNAKGKGNGQVSAEDVFGNSREAVLQQQSAKENPYYPAIYFVKTELLGDGAQSMYEQSRGLRNLINKFLNDPRIRELLMVKQENRVDFDAILSKNQITVVNSALEFGEEKSTAVGLFFLLNFRMAVVRRPGGYRSPHFLWTDETSQYMHPTIEDFITLFRQYQVSCGFAIQGLEQFEKNDLTKYLKGVFNKIGTQFVFGRISPDEMELYSKMSGEFFEDVIQATRSETSIFSDNPSVNTSERITPTKKAKIEGSDIRLMDFQEVTILTTDQGRVLAGMYAKVHFLKKHDFVYKGYIDVDFEKLKKKIEITDKEEAQNLEETGLFSNEAKAENIWENLRNRRDGVDEYLDSMTADIHPRWMKADEEIVWNRMLDYQSAEIKQDAGTFELGNIPAKSGINVQSLKEDETGEMAYENMPMDEYKNTEVREEEEVLTWFEMFNQ